MIAADIQFTPVSQKQFASLLREMSDLPGYEMPKVVRNAGRDFCRAALKVTPLAKRLTESDFQTDGGYLITTKHKTTGKRVTFIGTRAQFNEEKRGNRLIGKPGQYPQGRGYARLGWLRALISLGVNIKRKGSKASIQGINQAGDFVNGLKRPAPYVDIINRVPYIEKLDHGGPGQAPNRIMDRAMAATAYAMEKHLTKMVRKMAEKWNK